MDLKIGGYKNNQNSADVNLDLSKVTPTGDEPTGNEPTGNEPTGDNADIDNDINPTGDEPTGNEPTGNEPTGNEPTGDEPTGDENKPTGDEPAGNEPEGSSSLKPNTSNPTGDEPTGQPSTEVEVNDELLLSKLSEKLGRDIKSLEDLTKTSNPLDEDPYVKELLEWRKKTGRPIEDYVKFQKDYSKVSDIEVAREFLQIEYPDLTPEEVEFELQRNFISDEDDLDDDKRLKSIDLKKYASKGRAKLQEFVADLGNPNVNELSPEVQKQLDFAKQAQSVFESNKNSQAEYIENIKSKVNSFDTLKLNLSDDLSLDFKVETPKGNMVEMIESAPHWKNEDGSWNHEAVVKDAAIIANFDKIVRLAYEQGLNSGQEQVVKEAKNVTIDGTAQPSAANPNSGKGVEIEGLDNYLGKKGMRIKFGK